jgi:hypothetical protein
MASPKTARRGTAGTARPRRGTAGTARLGAARLPLKGSLGRTEHARREGRVRVAGPRPATPRPARGPRQARHPPPVGAPSRHRLGRPAVPGWVRPAGPARAAWSSTSGVQPLSAGPERGELGAGADPPARNLRRPGTPRHGISAGPESGSRGKPAEEPCRAAAAAHRPGGGGGAASVCRSAGLRRVILLNIIILNLTPMIFLIFYRNRVRFAPGSHFF